MEAVYNDSGPGVVLQADVCGKVLVDRAAVSFVVVSLVVAGVGTTISHDGSLWNREAGLERDDEIWRGGLCVIRYQTTGARAPGVEDDDARVREGKWSVAFYVAGQVLHVGSAVVLIIHRRFVKEDAVDGDVGESIPLWPRLDVGFDLVDRSQAATYVDVTDELHIGVAAQCASAGLEIAAWGKCAGPVEWIDDDFGGEGRIICYCCLNRTPI